MHTEILICSDLPSLHNGAISYNGGSTDIRPINTIATHSCNTGYTLNGDSVRVCQNDRTWSGSTPTCQGENKIIVTANTKYPCLQFPVAPLPLLTTDLPDNQPAQ